MATSTKKAIKKWLKIAEKQGWGIKGGGNSHYRLYPANKTCPMVVMPSTPGEGNRSYDNVLAKLKRAGLKL